MARFHGRLFIWPLILVTCNAIICASSETIMLSRALDEDGKQRIVALDGVLPKKTVDRLADLVMHRKTGSVWQYTLGDVETEPQLYIPRYKSARWPWMSRINASLLHRSATGKAFRTLAKRFTAFDDYKVSDAFGYLLRRGDSVRRTVADSDDDSALVVHVELSAQPWRKNDYGETLFFSVNEHEQSGKLEVEEAVHLKRGRVMLWHAKIPFSLRPPSMNYAQSRCGLLMLLTRDGSRAEASRKLFEVRVLLWFRREG